MSPDKINPDVYDFLSSLGRAAKRVEEKKTSTEELKHHLKRVKSLISKEKKHELSKELKELENRIFETVEKGQKGVHMSPEVRLSVEKLKDELERVKEKYDKTVMEKEEKINLLNDRIRIYADKIRQLNPKEEKSNKKEKIDVFTIKKQVEVLEKKYDELKEKYPEEDLKPVKERLENTKQRLRKLEEPKAIEDMKIPEMPSMPSLADKMQELRKDTTETMMMPPEESVEEEPQPSKLDIPNMTGAKEEEEPLPLLDKSEPTLPTELLKESSERKSFFSKFFKKKS